MKPLTVRFLAVPKEVGELRRALREHVGAPCADLQLCVSELVGNVIAHLGEGTPVTVRVYGTGGRVRVEVGDPDPRAWPLLRSVGERDESGRGLALVEAVSLRWGVLHGPGSGKTVWCELPQEAAQDGARSAAGARGRETGTAPHDPDPMPYAVRR
ncbi:ATP-binding protein [Streptomyces sp. NPDC006368]|uniref:ATP-binding protein n=1 Tax=Streptomyces sp. NPDC006368 TaxID=3156760 RepID=UPI0033B330B6